MSLIGERQYLKYDHLSIFLQYTESKTGHQSYNLCTSLCNSPIFRFWKPAVTGSYQHFVYCSRSTPTNSDNVSLLMWLYTFYVSYLPGMFTMLSKTSKVLDNMEILFTISLSCIKKERKKYDNSLVSTLCQLMNEHHA